MVDMFGNASLLTNICQYQHTLHLSCNYEIVTTNLVRDLEEYGTVWFQTEGISNILSLSQVTKLYLITYGSLRGKYFTVHKRNGGVRRFVEYPQGL